MPKKLSRGPTILVLGLILGQLSTGHTAQTTPPDEPLPVPSRLEMAAHQRLVEVMQDSHHQPSPFVTDGCSGGLSVAWTTVSNLVPGFAAVHRANPPWEGCCVTHDRAYHNAAGTKAAAASYRERLAADELLRSCVLETGKQRTEALTQRYPMTGAQVEQLYGFIAQAMFDAVRLGGGPCSGLPWRWGYGYPGCLWGE